jgi:hypothetical protein
MVKTLNIAFEDKEMEQLKKAKGDSKSWHDFIMGLTK